MTHLVLEQVAKSDLRNGHQYLLLVGPKDSLKWTIGRARYDMLNGMLIDTEYGQCILEYIDKAFKLQ